MSQAAYTMLGIIVFELGVVIAKHGQPRGNYSVWSQLLGNAILVAVLYWGGFFARGAA